MIIFAVLALAALADGYRLEREVDSQEQLLSLCKQNGVTESVIQSATMDFARCLSEHAQLTMMENDIKEAYENHTYDSLNRVFKKYCRKSPELKFCYNKLTEVTGRCLGSEKQFFVKLSIDMNNRVIDYLCEYDGSTITAFIMEGGTQCLSNNSYELMRCSTKYQNSFLYLNQNFTLSEIQNMYEEVINCFRRNVESCNSSTTYRILGRFSEIVRESIAHTILEANNSWNETTSNTTQEVPRYVPTTTSDRPWYYVHNTTERPWRYTVRPKINHRWYHTKPTPGYWGTNAGSWRIPTTVGYWDTPTTKRYWDTPATAGSWGAPTTEKVHNYMTVTRQNEKDISKGNHYNFTFYGQFGLNGAHYNTDKDTKNVDYNPERRRFQASANVAVMFNADIDA